MSTTLHTRAVRPAGTPATIEDVRIFTAQEQRRRDARGQERAGTGAGKSKGARKLARAVYARTS